MGESIESGLNAVSEGLMSIGAALVPKQQNDTVSNHNKMLSTLIENQNVQLQMLKAQNDNLTALVNHFVRHDPNNCDSSTLEQPKE